MNNLECQLVYEGKSERVNFKTNDPNPSLYVFAKKVFKDIPSDVAFYSEGREIFHVKDLRNIRIVRILRKKNECLTSQNKPLESKSCNTVSKEKANFIFRSKNKRSTEHLINTLGIQEIKKQNDVYEFREQEIETRERNCCLKNCCKKLSKEIMKENKLFWKHLDKQEFQKNLLHNFYLQGKENFNKKYIPLIGGVSVCERTFSDISGQSISCISKVILMYRNGKRRILPKGNHPRIKQKSDSIIAWMESIAIPKYGNNVPNKNEVRFPPSLSWKDLYEEYKTRIDLSKTTVSIATFYKTIDQNYGRFRDQLLGNPRVLIENKSSHGKCDMCAEIINIKSKSIKEEDIEFVKLLESNHRLDFGNERKAELSRNELSIQYPYKYLSICIDDNSHRQNGLPKPKLLTKSNSSWMKLDAHLTGTIATSGYLEGTRDVKFYYNLGNFVQDTNKTVTILLNRIIDIQEKFKLIGKSLPGTLFLLSDNKSGELKNKFTLGFLAYLVKKRKFDKIIYSQLLCGHTEWHIDAAFSPLKSAYMKSELGTIEDFESMLSKLNIPQFDRKIERVDFTLDWMGAIKSKLLEISGHSTVQSFEIVRNEDGNPVLRFKHRSSEEAYWPPQGFMILENGNWEFEDRMKVFSFRDIDEFSKFVTSIVHQYAEKISENDIKQKITDSWNSHIARLKHVHRTVTHASFKVNYVEGFNEPTLGFVSEHLDALNDKVSKKQDAHIRGSSFPIKIQSEVYSSSIAKEKQTVCVYTKSKMNRPWIGLVDKVLNNEVNISWYTKSSVNSSVKWKLTNEKDTVHFGSIMLWDLTQDVENNFNNITISRMMLKEIKETYKLLDDQFVFESKVSKHL